MQAVNEPPLSQGESLPAVLRHYLTIYYLYMYLNISKEKETRSWKSVIIQQSEPSYYSFTMNIYIISLILQDQSSDVNIRFLFSE